jgi:hypothetical protein
MPIRRISVLQKSYHSDTWDYLSIVGKSFLIVRIVCKVCLILNIFLVVKLSDHIQCGNFNWNNIRNLDVGDFVKIPKQVNYCFSLPTFWCIYGFHISVPGSAQLPVTSFFLNCRGMSIDILFQRQLRKECNPLSVF